MNVPIRTKPGAEPPVIEVSHVTKEYRLGALESFRSTLKRMLGRPVEERRRFKALDDVSFEVRRGEVVGLIGHNGAGKSTLLKHLCRITVPSSGTVNVRGRIAPLIEVGAGLIGEMTGRENIYLNASILGMSRQETTRKLDEIISFSELEQFIDTPVKRYSSGMQVRLGYGIATAVQSDILIIDEVLAVGDLAFQRKCITRMEALIQDRGTTVLLVSHNIRQVERVCTRAILLKNGVILADGMPSEVCNLFYDQSDQKILSDARNSVSSDPMAMQRGSGEVTLLGLRLLNSTGQPTAEINNNDHVAVELSIRVNDFLECPIFAIGVHTVDQLNIATPRSKAGGLPESLSSGEYKVRCTIESLPLLPGAYALRASISAGKISSTILYVENQWHFKVSSAGFERSMVGAEGLVSLSAEWAID